MKPGDFARVISGPWTGHAGIVTATFTGGWVAVRIASMERTFAATELTDGSSPHRTVVSEGGARYACLDCPATSRNRPPTGPCNGDAA